MNFRLLAISAAVSLATLSGAASAITVKFNNTEAPGVVNGSPPSPTAWSGLNVTGAYWYSDARDTFDGQGLSVNPIGRPGTGVVVLDAVSPSVTVDYWAISGNGVTVNWFDSAHLLLGTVSLPTAGVDVFGTMTFGGGVKSVEWSGNGGFAQISTMTFAGAVPEPETYALMLAGLGVVGFMARRRKA